MILVVVLTLYNLKRFSKPRKRKYFLIQISVEKPAFVCHIIVQSFVDKYKPFSLLIENWNFIFLCYKIGLYTEAYILPALDKLTCIIYTRFSKITKK